MREIFCAANWKLNKGPIETQSFLVDFLNQVNREDQKKFAIFPPALNLFLMSEFLKGSSVKWGAQNVCFESEGAFTGENSAKVVKSLGASMCLVGHSERRVLFGESNKNVAKKIGLLQDLGMTPLLCLGENLEERVEGRTHIVVESQLHSAMSYANWSQPLVLAYEPVWAIGTGQVATPEQAEDIHRFLRSRVKEWAGVMVADQIKILYGGSVKPSNSKDLFAQENIDGFLIGGASLKPDSLIEIYSNTQ